MTASVNLATLTDAKAHIKTESLSAESDAQITALIGAASLVVEQTAGRTLKKSAGVVEYLSVGRGQTRFVVAVYPVTAVNSLKIASDWDWASATAYDADEFRISDNGAILLKRCPRTWGPDALEIDYDGGLITDEADAKSNFPGLHEACLQIVNMFWTRRDDLLRSGEGGDGWSIQREEVKIPKATMALIRPYMDSSVLW